MLIEKYISILDTAFEQPISKEKHIEIEDYISKKIYSESIQKIFIELIKKYGGDYKKIDYSSIEHSPKELKTDYPIVDVSGKIISVFPFFESNKFQACIQNKDEYVFVYDFNESPDYSVGDCVRFEKYFNQTFSKKQFVISSLLESKVKKEQCYELNPISTIFCEKLTMMPKICSFKELIVRSWVTKTYFSKSGEQKKYQYGVVYNEFQEYSLFNWTNINYSFSKDQAITAMNLFFRYSSKKYSSRETLSVQSSTIFIPTSRTIELKKELFEEKNNFNEEEFEERSLSIAGKTGLTYQKIKFVGRIQYLMKDIKYFDKCMVCNSIIDYCKCLTDIQKITKELIVSGILDDQEQTIFFKLSSSFLSRLFFEENESFDIFDPKFSYTIISKLNELFLLKKVLIYGTYSFKKNGEKIWSSIQIKKINSVLL